MKLRKKLITLVAVCLVTVLSTGMFTVSAEKPQTEFLSIQPFASPIVSSTAFSIAKSQCWVDISLNKSYSGTISATIQKQNGSSWTNHTTICTNDSFNGSFIYKSRATSLESGTYRISYTIVTGGVSYPITTSSRTV